MPHWCSATCKDFKASRPGRPRGSTRPPLDGHNLGRRSMRPRSHMRLLISASAVALALGAGTALAGMDEARRWVDTEFQPSTLSKEQQLKEMEWFVNAAKPFQNIDVRVVSETITTHEYEARTLAKAFTEITGIKVTHDIIQEGDVVEKI